MAKEIIPPDPIPVGEIDTVIEDLYCASFMNYSEKSYSDTTKDLIHYLENEFNNVGFGGSTSSYIAENSTEEEVISLIVNANIDGIDENTISRYAIIMQNGSDVLITVIHY